jgi:hypothetical protein
VEVRRWRVVHFKLPEEIAIRTSVKVQVAGHLGKALGAPVIDVWLVRISRTLLAAQQLPVMPTNDFEVVGW